MERALGTVYDASGNKLDTVTVTVKKAGTGTNATLYADETGVSSKSNPFTNDTDGSWEFYAANGRYDIQFTKTGHTFTNDNTANIILFDPRDDQTPTMFKCDFWSAYKTGSDVISDGHHWRQVTGNVTAVAGTSTYRNGWMDIIETGAAQGAMSLADNGNNLALLWTPGTDVIIFESRLERVGSGVNGTRQVALANAAGTHYVTIRQVDGNNAFVAVAAGGSESTSDLGVTINAMKKVRVTITSTNVRPYVDDVAKTALTTNIPTAMLGISVTGGATASAAGVRVDYINVVSGVRI